MGNLFFGSGGQFLFDIDLLVAFDSSFHIIFNLRYQILLSVQVNLLGILLIVKAKFIAAGLLSVRMTVGLNSGLGRF